jgi:hypothetical protein
MWEDKRLRDITEADVRQLVNSGLEEHLQLEYKSALYDDSKEQARESLLDICMFANAGGGILLIGVSEQRDENGQPTGIPDPTATLGVELSNPEQLLLSYDNRVVANIQERLSVEMSAIPIVDRYVVAIRVPNSMSKPHRVQYQGRVHFPSRRERHKYEMDVREIKEMVMRTASRMEEAERKMGDAFLKMPRQDDSPHLIIGCIPVFWRDFLVDLRNEQIVRAVGMFHLGYGQNFRQPVYSFTGLEREIHNDISAVHVHRNGLVVLNRRFGSEQAPGAHHFFPTAIDTILRTFLLRTADVYRATELGGPYLLSMMLRARNALRGIYQELHPGAIEDGGLIALGDYAFPIMQADNLLDIDRVTRPLCDQAHQMFGRDASPSFDANGVWNG